MDNEKIRAEFEKWADDNGFRIGERPLLWLAWQASRAALAVELPTRFDAGFDAVLHEHQDGEVLEYEATVAALTAAGITVKEGV